MNGICEIEIFGEVLVLLPQKAIYLPEHKTLLAADLHLGKAGHFRNAGIAVPMELASTDLDKLSFILNELDVERLIIVGDLFHAKMNSDWRFFEKWRTKYNKLKIELIKGNHDILHEEHYTKLDVEIHNDYCIFLKFLLTHNPPRTKINMNGCEYIICGHVHPAVRLKGKGKQSITLPCFILVKHMPCFGHSEGLPEKE
jgi:DNA ligase-associated metallophosphoesterase